MMKPDAKDSLIRQRARIRGLISDYSSRLFLEPTTSPLCGVYREIIGELQAILAV
jgi:hypothetical protein